MTITEFVNKLYNYAPQLLMDYRKSKIQVIFMDNENFLYKSDMITEESDGLSFWLTYFNADRKDKPVEMKPDIKGFIERCNQCIKYKYKIHINLPPDNNGNIHDAILDDRDPFEAYGSLVFRITRLDK